MTQTEIDNDNKCTLRIDGRGYTEVSMMDSAELQTAVDAIDTSSWVDMSDFSFDSLPTTNESE